MANHSYFSHKTTPKTQLTVKATTIIPFYSIVVELLIFTSFVSPPEKLRKRLQEKENQKVSILCKFPMHKMG
jgi:hypothetical protein